MQKLDVFIDKGTEGSTLIQSGEENFLVKQTFPNIPPSKN